MPLLTRKSKKAAPPQPGRVPTHVERIKANVSAHPIKWVVAIVVTLGGVATAITALWDMGARVSTQADSHWQTRVDADKHEEKDKLRETEQKARNDAQDKSIEKLSLYNRLSSSQLRAQFMEDRVYDCAARRQTGVKMTVADATICERYRAEYDTAQKRIESLRQKLDGK